jgi:MFS family permease
MNPERRHDDEPHEPLFTRELFLFFMISAMLMTTLSCMQQATGFFLQDAFHLTMAETTQKVGIALMASAVASVGSPLILLGVVGFISTDTFEVMVASMGCFGLGFGVMMPGNISSLSMTVAGHQQGRVAGINTSAQGFGFIAGPLLGSELYPVHRYLPYIARAVLAAGTIFMVYRVVRISDSVALDEE